MTQPGVPLEGFDPLDEFLLEDIMSASDEQLLSEVEEDFGDRAALARAFDLAMLNQKQSPRSENEGSTFGERVAAPLFVLVLFQNTVRTAAERLAFPLRSRALATFVTLLLLVAVGFGAYQCFDQYTRLSRNEVSPVGMPQPGITTPNAEVGQAFNDPDGSRPVSQPATPGRAGASVPALEVPPVAEAPLTPPLRHEAKPSDGPAPESNLPGHPTPMPQPESPSVPPPPRNLHSSPPARTAESAKGQDDLAIADFSQAVRRIRPEATDLARRLQQLRASLSRTPEASPAQPAAPARPLREPLVASPPSRRVALVIGNSAYHHVRALPNPRRDAEAVATALRQAGFQSIELAVDFGRNDMVRALRKFRDQAENADWALVYFAGHGIEIDRTNYLVPVDARLADDLDVKDEAVSYETVLNSVRDARALRLIVLDACRVNPFKKRMRRSISVRRGTDRGLAAPPETEPGTLTVYSAKEGEVAEDDVGGDISPFARAFVAALKEVPGLEVRRLFDTVRDDVVAATHHRQQPFTYGSLPARGDFFFTDRASADTIRSAPAR